MSQSPMVTNGTSPPHLSGSDNDAKKVSTLSIHLSAGLEGLSHSLTTLLYQTYKWAMCVEPELDRVWCLCCIVDRWHLATHHTQVAYTAYLRWLCFSVIDFIVVLSGGVLKNIVPCSLHNLCVKEKLKVDNMGYWFCTWWFYVPKDGIDLLASSSVNWVSLTKKKLIND